MVNRVVIKILGLWSCIISFQYVVCLVYEFFVAAFSTYVLWVGQELAFSYYLPVTIVRLAFSIITKVTITFSELDNFLTKTRR